MKNYEMIEKFCDKNGLKVHFDMPLDNIVIKQYSDNHVFITKGESKRRWNYTTSAGNRIKNITLSQVLTLAKIYFR